MSPEQADDWISEHGALSPMDVWNRDRDDQEAGRLVLSGQVLADLAAQAAIDATALAIRANEMDAFTDTWVCDNPDARLSALIASRRAKAEDFREQAAIHRRRATALEDGARALGAKVPEAGG